MITNEMRTEVLELYTAYFNRAADRAGVDYWLNEMNVNSWNIDMVAQSFAEQTEYINIYGSMTNAQIVSQVYQNVLNRDTDVAGAAYWEGELNNGVIQVSQLIQAVINAAKNDVGNIGDDEVIANKSSASQYAYDKYNSNTNISLAHITSSSSSISTIYEEIIKTDTRVLTKVGSLYGDFQKSTSGTNFGDSLSVYDNIIAVGAPGEDYEGYEDVGYVYIFENNNGIFERVNKFTLPTYDLDDGVHFGDSVVVGKDSLAVGIGFTWSNLPDEIYLYELNNNTSTLVDTFNELGRPNPFFSTNNMVLIETENNSDLFLYGLPGFSVAGWKQYGTYDSVYIDESLGREYYFDAGVVNIISTSTGQLVDTLTDQTPDNFVGYGHTLYSNDNILVVGTVAEHSQENVYVYDISENGTLTFKDELSIPAKTMMGNYFYYDLAVNEDYLVVADDDASYLGYDGAGAVYIYEWSQDHYNLIETLTNIEAARSGKANFGDGIALMDNNQLIVNDNNLLKIYSIDNSTITYQNDLGYIPSDAAIYSDGETLLIQDEWNTESYVDVYMLL